MATTVLTRVPQTFTERVIARGEFHRLRVESEEDPVVLRPFSVLVSQGRTHTYTYPTPVFLEFRRRSRIYLPLALDDILDVLTTGKERLTVRTDL